MSPVMPRRCGPCNACCVSLGVPPLNKPPGQPCSFLQSPMAGGRCNIYNERPAECRAFRCAYLEGHAVPRPDELGVVIVLADEKNRTDLAILHRPGAFDMPAWIKLRETRVKQGRLVIQSAGGKREVFGNDDAMDRLVARLKAGEGK